MFVVNKVVSSSDVPCTTVLSSTVAYETKKTETTAFSRTTYSMNVHLSIAVCRIVGLTIHLQMTLWPVFAILQFHGSFTRDKSISHATAGEEKRFPKRFP